MNSGPLSLRMKLALIDFGGFAMGSGYMQANIEPTEFVEELEKRQEKVDCMSKLSELGSGRI